MKRLARLAAVLLSTGIFVPLAPAAPQDPGPYIFRFKNSGGFATLTEARMSVPDLYVGERVLVE